MDQPITSPPAPAEGYTPPAGPDRRPGTVTTAAWLLAAVAVAYLLDAVMLLANAAGYPDRVAAAARESGVDPQVATMLRPVAAAFPFVAAVLTLIIAAVIAVLSLLIRRRSQAARVTTWVGAGLTLLCGLCAAGQSGTPAASGIFYLNASSRNSSGAHLFAQRLPQGYPASYRISSAIIGTLALLALIAVVILLARPASNAWFRKPAAAAHPGYPVHPGLPAYPATGDPGQAAAYPAPGYPAAAPALPEHVRSAQALLAQRRDRGELTDEQYRQELGRLLGLDD